MISLEQRMEKVHSNSDFKRQLASAFRYSKTLRTKAKKQDLLEDKLAMQKESKSAEDIALKMRRFQFNVQDGLAKGYSGTQLMAAFSTPF